MAILFPFFWILKNLMLCNSVSSKICFYFNRKGAQRTCSVKRAKILCGFFAQGFASLCDR